MISYCTGVAIAAAPEHTSDPALRRLLADRIAGWAATDLLHLTKVVVVEPGDTEGAIVEEVGFSPLANPAGGARYPSPRFVAHHDWIERHGGWTELLFTGF